MMPQRPRAGVYATIRGAEYQVDAPAANGLVLVVHQAEVNPAADLFSWSAAHNAWLAQVPVAHCERLVEVRSEAEHRGLRCQVVSIDATGAVGLYYVGDEKSAAQKRGFTQIDVGTWAKTVNIFEIDRYYETHQDLLFDERVPQLFGNVDA